MIRIPIIKLSFFNYSYKIWI